MKTYIELENPTPKQKAFYNQKFYPELITKLFEGWEAPKNKNRGYENQKENLIICGTTIIIYFTIGITSESFFYPVILDQFISDCQRAGISLELKPETRKKLGL